MRCIPNSDRERQLNKFVRRLNRKIKQQKRDCREHHEMIFTKLRSIDESIEIIARQMARQVKGESQ